MERKYPCGVYNKTFSITYNLKAQQRVHTGYIHTPVMCHKTFMDIVRSYVNVYILGSVHIVVMCVIEHSLTKGTRRYISIYILGSVHITVTSVIERSVSKLA